MNNSLIDKKDINIPNLLSLIRLMLSIPLIIFFSNLNEYRIYLLPLLILIVLTDNLDGYLARKLNQITDFGKLLDPLSDKITIIIMVVFMYVNNEIPVFYFWLVLFKSIYIYLGGAFIYLKTRIVPSSDLFGKSSFLILGIFLVWSIIANGKFLSIYYILLSISTLSIITTIIAYSIKGFKMIKTSTN